MDPNEALRQIRSITDYVNADSYSDDMQADLDRLAELFEALDQWLSKGGFLPNAWGSDISYSHSHDI